MPHRLLLLLALSLGLGIASYVFAGCGGDSSVPEPTPGSDGGAAIQPGSASGGTSHDLAGVTDLGGDLATGGNANCDQPQSTASLGKNASGFHNAGENCGNCHGSGQLKWTLAGTLYDGVGSSTAVAGATIHVTDANNTSITIVTADNGNFWTSRALTPPFKVSASLCPNKVAMNSTASASCNSCHVSGFRVHLP